MVREGWLWRAPPGWPPPPPGWSPPSGWAPPPEWPSAPAGWQFWYWGVDPTAPPSGPPPLERVAADKRRDLVLETWFVQLVFLIPGITGAIGTFAELASGRDISQFPTFVHGQPVLNLVLGVVTYTAVLVPVPIALLLLSRTGQPPRSLGLGRLRFRADLAPAAGLALGGYAIAFALGIVLAPLLASLRDLVQQVPIGDVPRYYIVYALLLSAMTAIAEETLVSGYLLTRLEQLGWTPQRALILSLVLRTSYHVYYGVGLIFTIPVGYLLTRSFQKHRRLNRPIVAHFLYDAVLLTLSILFVS